MPAILRVGRLRDEDVDHAKMEFPGTYNRRGLLVHDRVEAIERDEGGATNSHDLESKAASTEDELELLEDAFPFLMSG